MTRLRYDRIVAGLATSLASVAIFVVGLYSPFISFWLASGLVMSLSALMFGGIVLLPRARKTRSAIPDPVIQYLFALVLTSGIVIMLVAMVILGVCFNWLRFGEFDRKRTGDPAIRSDEYHGPAGILLSHRPRLGGSCDLNSSPPVIENPRRIGSSIPVLATWDSLSDDHLSVRRLLVP